MPFLRAWIAKPDMVVELVFVVDNAIVDSRGADADALLDALLDALFDPFLLVVLLNKARFLRVNCVRFS